jgi:hypothetical protein
MIKPQIFIKFNKILQIGHFITLTQFILSYYITLNLMDKTMNCNQSIIYICFNAQFETFRISNCY